MIIRFSIVSIWLPPPGKYPCFDRSFHCGSNQCSIFPTVPAQKHAQDVSFDFDGGQQFAVVVQQDFVVGSRNEDAVENEVVGLAIEWAYAVHTLLGLDSYVLLAFK